MLLVLVEIEMVPLPNSFISGQGVSQKRHIRHRMREGMMRLTKTTKSKVLVTAGLAQLLIAGSALGYFVYLRTEVSRVGESVGSLVQRAPVQQEPTLPPRKLSASSKSLVRTAVFAESQTSSEAAAVRFIPAAFSQEPKQTPPRTPSPECAHFRINHQPNQYYPGLKVKVWVEKISGPPDFALSGCQWTVDKGNISSQGGNEAELDTTGAVGTLRFGVTHCVPSDPKVCVIWDKMIPIPEVPPPITPTPTKPQRFEGHVDFGSYAPANKAGIRVQVTCPSGSGFTAFTDANGAFSFTTEQSGQCTFTFSRNTDGVILATSVTRQLTDGNSQLGAFTVSVNSQSTPTPTPSPTPTATPTPTPTPTVEGSALGNSVSTEKAKTGAFSVTWPRALARGEKGVVTVKYTPPENGRMPQIAENYDKVEVQLAPIVSGLIVDEPDWGTPVTLADKALYWFYHVTVSNEAGSTAICDINVAASLTSAQNASATNGSVQFVGFRKSLQPVVMKGAEIRVPMVPPKAWLATSGIFGPFGTLTLGLGFFPPKPRYVNVSFVNSEKETFPRNTALTEIKSYYVRINVGPLSRETIVQHVREFPARLLPSSDTGHWLDAVVASDDFKLNRLRYRFFLPNSGPSWVCECHPGHRHTCNETTREEYLYIAIETKKRTTEAKLRIGIYYDNNLIQSQLITVEVAEFEREGREQVSFIDYTLAANLDSLTSFSPRTVNILANDSGNGTHTIVINGAVDDAITFNLTEGQVENAIRSIRQSLIDVHRTRGHKDFFTNVEPENLFDEHNAKSTSHFIADLRMLAPLGALLWERLFTDQIAQWRKLEDGPLKKAGTIQVSRVEKGTLVFPWGAVYEIPLESDKGRHRNCRLLEEWDQAETLINAEQPGCPFEYTHEINTICPFGFWGFKHIIEQPPSMPKDRDLQRVIKVGKRPIDLVVGVSLDLDASLAKIHLDALETGLANVMKVIQRCSKEDIRSALANPRVELVYFYCHGGRQPLEGSNAPTPFLGIGNQEILTTGDLVSWKRTWDRRHWEDTAPLVFINGCHTAEITPDMLVNFVETFIGIYAAGVIGTEIVLDQRVAGEAAQIFFDSFKNDKCSVGVALQRVRRTLLLKGNVLGLVYTPYCSADLHLA